MGNDQHHRSPHVGDAGQRGRPTGPAAWAGRAVGFGDARDRQLRRGHERPGDDRRRRRAPAARRRAGREHQRAAQSSAVRRRPQPASSTATSRSSATPTRRSTPKGSTLLRLLGSNFVDPNATRCQATLAARCSRASTTSTSRFHDREERQRHHDDRRDERRERRPARARSLAKSPERSATISTARIPTSIDEYSIMRSEQGEQYQTVKTRPTCSSNPTLPPHS